MSLFIVFEGVDGVGKSTALKGLYDRLMASGHDCIKTREPGGTSVGGRIRQLLLEGENLSLQSELFLYLADRVQHVEEVIRPALVRGQVVLCDRFVESTLAYQGKGRELDTPLFREMVRNSACGLVPDFTFVLDREPIRSGAPDRMEREGNAFYERVRRHFLGIRGAVHVNAQRSPHEIVEEVERHVQQRLQKQS